MIYDLTRLQIPSDLLLHHETVLPYVPLVVGVRVVRHVQKDVTVLVDGSPTVPEVVVPRTSLGLEAWDSETNHPIANNLIGHTESVSDLLTAHSLCSQLP